MKTDIHKSFKQILFYSEELMVLYDKFINENNFSSADDLNLIIAAKTIEDGQIGTEILILQENKTKFFKLIDNFIKSIDNSNKPLIDFAFKSHY